MKVLIDNSFIRLKPTLAQANELLDGKLCRKFNEAFIKILPTDRFAQMTNSSVPIIFNDDFKVEIIDCCENVLLDITNNTTIKEFTNIETGIANIFFEILKVGQSFNIPIHLKFSHWSGGMPVSSLVMYSNPFYITDHLSERTVKLDYSGINVQYGADYTTNAGKYQSIRIGIAPWDFADETVNETYLQSTGVTIEGSAPITVADIYIFSNLTRFAFEALKCWRHSSILYIDNIRATSTKFSKGEPQGESNTFDGKLTAYLNRTEQYVETYQLRAPYELMQNRSPLGVYTLALLPTKIRGTFNRPTTLGVGTFSVYEKGTDILQQTFTQADITMVTANTFEINITGLITVNSEYYINFDLNLFLSDFQESVEINNDIDWVFKTQNADYDSSDYDGTQPDYMT